jgi:hypothetical protein
MFLPTLPLPPLPHIAVPPPPPLPHVEMPHLAMPHLFDLKRLTPHDTARVSHKVTRTRIGKWTLTVTRDAFNGVVACSLDAPGMAVDKGAVAFRFSPKQDTSAAEYRLNDGPVVPVRSNLPTLAGLGVQVVSDDLANPSRGMVYIPVKVIGASSYVWIRTEKRGPARVFKVHDLEAAVFAARADKCEPSFLGEEAVAR